MKKLMLIIALVAFVASFSAPTVLATTKANTVLQDDKKDEKPCAKKDSTKCEKDKKACCKKGEEKACCKKGSEEKKPDSK